MSDWSSGVCSSDLEEYWFDHGWRDVIDETATANDINLEVGAKLRHAVWGLGTIQELKRHGAGINLLIDFGDEGRKLIPFRSEEHTSELQSLMRISYAVFCLKKKKKILYKLSKTTSIQHIPIICTFN